MNIASKNNVDIHTYGYSNREKGNRALAETLFELGSMSKAFIGLGILYLEQEGTLRLEDDIRKYIPWLKMKCKGDFEGKRVNEYVPISFFC